jgi:putative transferase (TIGR04331 family)
MSIPRCLITTADERSWVWDRPVVFLGEWCKRYSRKDCRVLLDAITIPYHWDDRDKLYCDYLIINKLNERLLEAIVKFLNHYHGVERTTKYWRIVIGPWLNMFVQMLFDRWEMIQKASSEYNISGTILLEFDESEIIPQTMHDFYSLYTNDVWNHYVYSEALRTTNIKKFEKSIEQLSESDDGVDTIHIKVFGKNMLKKIASILSGVLSINNKYFIYNSQFSRYEEWKLSKELGQFPTYIDSPVLDVIKPNMSKRSELKLQFMACNKFELFVQSLLLRQIPVTYLEGYTNTLQKVDKVFWSKNPKVILTASEFVSNDFFKIWAAGKVEKGSKLLTEQHGGHYGVGKFSSLERHQLDISDKFLSWGWVKPRVPKVVPLTAAKLISASKIIKSNPNGGVLHVMSEFPRYSYDLYSVPISSQQKTYEDEQLRFAKRLNPEVLDMHTVRLYPGKKGWDQRERWLDALPSVRFDHEKSMYKSICKNKLFICTYNATTFLETFSANIPTIMFWNPDHWELNDFSEPYFNQLAKVGILHYTPESAADLVNSIWNDVEAWWFQAEIQNARICICDNFARVSPTWLEEWVNELKV